ncbi:MAG: uroporphyrinogen-III C-methyltransferase [Proteobacteria bacterium]|nr:uroporphyrinogen-III C-methyltransferase [Pseudomonadota bacterium]
MESLGLEMPDFAPGSVWLVGAGPGDPGLLSLHALHALRQADIVVYDALVDTRVLKLARAGAILEFAGKRGGKPSPKQRDISLRLVDLAREGKRVLRLKGGDPFVFGRGGEEALALAGARIPFRIVPGITSGIGGLAYAGIPVTHRDTNQSVTFVTGHGVTGDVPDGLDWHALAHGASTIVFYMALKHLERIAALLVGGGKSAATPAAIVVRASTPDQRVLETTLGHAARDAAAAMLEPPALFVVGEVVRLRAGLDWLGAAQGRILDSNPLGLDGRGTAESA